MYQQDGIIYARTVFNGVVWNTLTNEDMEQKKGTAANEIGLLLKEDLIHEEI